MGTKHLRLMEQAVTCLPTLHGPLVAPSRPHGARSCLPFHDPQVQHGDAIKDRHEQKGDESGNGQSADLRGTKRLP